MPNSSRAPAAMTSATTQKTSEKIVENKQTRSSIAEWNGLDAPAVVEHE